MSQFRMLLWKDYHVNRGVLLTGALILLAMLVAIPAIAAWDAWRRPSVSVTWCEVWAGGAFMSLVLSQLTIAVLAGNAVAGERADRSAEFLVMLPARRALVLASKLLLTLLGALAIWAIDYPLLLLSPAADGPGFCDHTALVLLFVSVLVYGTGWLGSVLLRNPATATAIAIAAPLALTVVVRATLYRHDESLSTAWFGGIALSFGVAQLLVAIIVFLRRREP
jgi:hypothetical protein